MQMFLILAIDPANLSQVNSRNTGKNVKICLKLTIKTPERCQSHRSGDFNVNFEIISHLF